MTQFKRLALPICQTTSKAFFLGVGLAIAVLPNAATANPRNPARLSADGTTPTQFTDRQSGDTHVIEITGGAAGNGNLFHSFREFNVDRGQRVEFDAGTASNIFSRVTGGNESNINGTIAVNGNANLFLLNPEGIIFGANARLDVRGSFLATTANAIEFEGGLLFSADETAPPLLAISPEALLFNRIGNTGINLESGTRLEVPAEQSLLLVGSNASTAPNANGLSINGGTLLAPGGRIELGAIAAPGNIQFEEDSPLRLDFDTFPETGRSNITLTNNALIEVSADESGNISLYGRSLRLAEDSRVIGLIPTDGGFSGAESGDIRINMTEDVRIINGGLIENSVQTNATGFAGRIIIAANGVVRVSGFGAAQSRIESGIADEAQGRGGEITIRARSFELINGGLISTSTSGSGNAGNLAVRARDRVIVRGEIELLVAGEVETRNSVVFSNVGEAGIGNAGNILITSNSLLIQDGAQIQSITNGRGRAGMISIRARNRVVLRGLDVEGLPSAIFASVSSTGRGRGGLIEIQAPSLILNESGLLFVETLADPSAGSIRANVNQLILRNGSELTASTSGAGRGGNITIENADRIRVLDGSEISANATGAGRGGNITIENADRIRVLDGSEISANATSTGRAGTLNVDANVVTVRGGTFSAAGQWQPSSLNFATESIGNAGRLDIVADRLIIQDGAAVTARTTNVGDAGIIVVEDAELVEVSGTAPDGTPSRLSFDTQGAGNAQAQGIFIGTQRLLVRDGAQITVGSGTLEAGETPEQLGNPGNLVIVAGSIALEDNALVTAAASQGDGGNIRLRVDDEMVVRESRVNASTTGRGTGGNITAVVGDLALSDQGILSTSTEGGAGGEIRIRTEDSVVLRRQSEISTFPENIGDGGTIDIEAPNGFVLAVLPEDSDIIASARRGDGGDAEANALGVLGFRQFQGVDTPESDFTADSEFGLPGTVIIEAEEQELPELPENVFVPRIAQGCEVRGDRPQSEFVVTGSAGLPTRPDRLDDSSVWEDLRPAEQVPTSDASSAPDLPPSSEPIVEAQGWVMGSNGEVVLVAAAPIVTPQSGQSVAIACPPP